ncbi:MAG: hypothetical protein CMC08_01615 [Flavobacteriaceae bacterium]|nr:hypothetical protein [Flavobacteriaceae bacterium]
MKSILFALACTLCIFNSNAQNPSPTPSNEGTTITVTVPVQSNDGTIIVALFEEDNFMKKPTQGKESEIIDGQASVTFENVLPGIYAVTLFHDKNGNKQMDFQPNGMPIEMYGVSNNVMTMGPPKWDDARFQVASTPLSLEIRM